MKVLASILFLWEDFLGSSGENVHYLYIYKKYIWFGLVGFYGISNIKGYLMPNPCYTYKKKLYTRTATKKAVLLPKKFSSDDDPGFRHGFGAETSLLLTKGTPAVSHSTTRLYWMVFDLYKCHICSYIWSGLIEFYGISTIVGYLMSNPLYIYIMWFVDA